jgi:hypothetical protein
MGNCDFGKPSKIRAIRVSIPETDGPTIDSEDYKRYLKLRIYLLDCIRINYDASIEYFRRGDAIFSFHNFLEPDVGLNMAVRIREPPNPDYRVNSEGLKALIAAPPNMRPIVHLIADGSDYRLPLQFRFLSVYKIIEMHFAVTPNRAFSAFIKPFIPAFHAVYPDVVTVAELCKALSALRNRCAHIELTTGELGFSHPEAETEELYNAMPIVKRIAIQCVRVKYPNSPLRFSPSLEEAEAEFEEMEREGLKPIRVSGP